MPNVLLRWVVAEPKTLAAVLEEMAAPASALEQGRVFLDGRRVVHGALELRVGQTLEVGGARDAAPQALVVARRDGLLAVHKPAGIATEPDRSGLACAREQAARALGVKEGTLHAVSRLDVGVSGVVLMAEDARARALLTQARAAGRLVRRYIGIGCGEPADRAGTLRDPVRAVRGRRREPQPAATRYRVVACRPAEKSYSLLALAPETGRTHQLRIHCSQAGAPLLGDATYGGPRRIVSASGSVEALSRVALHAAWVEVRLAAGDCFRAEANEPADLVELWRSLGGTSEEWRAAVAVEL
jgi:23S rRNA pseudouridine1911/1915/1917 synthase